MTTIRDIARAAGVSVSTASLALNGDDRVRESTRARVEQAAIALNYHPTRAARSLSKGRTWSVHLLYPALGSMSSGFFTRFLGGLHDGARDRGFSVALSVPVDAEEARVTLYRLMRERWADGVVLMNLATNDPLVRDALDYDFPHVVVGRPAFVHALSVDNDNHGVAFAATEHLLERGCRDLVLLNGSTDQGFTRERAEGFQAAHDARGLAVATDGVAYTDGRPESAGRLLTERLRTGARVDGVVAVSDTLAVAGLQAIRDHGLAVPRDVRVIGMNNDDISRFVTPRLSSVELHALELGRVAAELLLCRIEGRADTSRRRIVPHALIVRESSA